jgi:tetratricopeptide (TPR) repeat protein
VAAAQSTNLGVSKKAFEQIVKASDALDDKSLLYYSLKKTRVEDLTEIGKELFYNRLGDMYIDDNKPDQGLLELKKSLALNPDNEEALYLSGLAYIKKNDPASAIVYYEKLYKKYFDKPSTLRKKAEATLALARTHYNSKHWNEAISLYREIPKDNDMYRQAQAELTWSLFRAAQFRSALSVVQSLNTPYYENFYNPESLVLRSLILLFVCQNEDLEKSIQLFKRNYLSTLNVINVWNSSNYSALDHYKEVEQTLFQLNKIKNGNLPNFNGKLPFFLVRAILEEPDIKLKISYLNKIKLEKRNMIAQFQGRDFVPFVKFGTKVIDTRIKNISIEIGQMIKGQLLEKEDQLSEFASQFEFINYEMLNMKKEVAKKKANAAPGTEPATQVNQNDKREFYIQNGYQYYPFQGEFWRDEIGNYQYVGVNRCE